MTEDGFDPPGWPFNQVPSTPDDAEPSYEPPPHPGYASEQTPSVPAPPDPSHQPPPPGPSRYEPPAWQAGNVGQPPAPKPGAFAPKPTRRRRRMWSVAWFVIVAVFILIASCTMWLVRTAIGPVDAANEFLAAIDDGNYMVATSLTDPSCNNGLTADDLAARFDQQDISYNLNQSSIDPAGASVTGRITIGFESELPIRLDLKKSTDWRVCRFAVG